MVNVDIKTTPIEDSFDLGDELGRGKFGVVKKCRCKDDDEDYAAKFIRKRKTRVGRGQRPEDIYREIEIMQNLNGHPRIVSLEAVFEDKTNIIMVMELLRGTELFAVLAKKDHFMETEAIDYLKQMLNGIAFIHHKGYIHLDLKPENVVLQDEGCQNLKIIDFGLAQKYDPRAEPKEIVGTPEFMAPESISFEPTSPATDMWAVGVITYILLSGCSPFLGDDDIETYGNITSGEVAFPEEYFADLSPEVQDFICELLAPKPADRLTAEKTLQHKWLAPKKTKNFKRIGTKRLRRFNAQRKWQEAIQAVLRTLMMARVVGYLKEMVEEREKNSSLPVNTETEPKLKRTRTRGSTIRLRDRSLKDKKKKTVQSPDVDAPVEVAAPEITVKGEDCETDLVKGVITVEMDFAKSIARPPGSTGSFERQGRKTLRLNRGQVRFRRAGSTSIDNTSLAIPGVAEESQSVDTSGEAGAAVEEKSSLANIAVQVPAVPPPSPAIGASSAKAAVHEELAASHLRSQLAMSNALPTVDLSKLEVAQVLISSASQTEKLNEMVERVVRLSKENEELKRMLRTMGESVASQQTTENSSGRRGFERAPAIDDGTGLTPKTSDSMIAKHRDAEDMNDGRPVSSSSRSAFESSLSPRTSGPGTPSISDRQRHLDSGRNMCNDHSTRSAAETSAANSGVTGNDAREQPTQDLTIETVRAFYFTKTSTGPAVSIQECLYEDLYEDREEIKEGKFGSVRLCLCRKNGQSYVAKHIRKHRPRAARGRQRSDIVQEIEIMNKLNFHRHIVQLHGAVEGPSSVVLILEQLTGGELFPSLAARDTYSEGEVINFVKQILCGLAFIHHKNLMHLSLQPENIVLQSNSSGVVKIINFSCAQPYDGEGMSQEIVGHPEFTAPEIIAFAPAGPAVDMWAVGVLVYILLTGCSPFLDDDESLIYENISNADLSFPMEHFGPFPLSVTDFIQLLLSPNPKDRLTAEQCFSHRWLATPVSGNVCRIETNRLRQYNAHHKKKVR
eukprot:scpid27316/ scgid4885/ Death-associated protein kinase 1